MTDEILLQKMIAEANNQIFLKSCSDNSLSGMGTTFTMCFLLGKSLIAAHVGDSRMYLLRAGKLKKLTRDHSLVAELVKSGSITELEAQKHPQKNVITRAVGAFAEVDADIFSEELKEGDIILLCTDGLTNEISEKKILNTIKEESSLMGAAQKLVFCALDAGGKDNITAVLLKI